MAATPFQRKSGIQYSAGVTGFTQGLSTNASAASNQTIIPPATIGTVGQALTIASIASPNVTLGYSTVNTSPSTNFGTLVLSGNHVVTAGDIGSTTGTVITQTGAGNWTLTFTAALAAMFPNFDFVILNNSTAATTNTVQVAAQGSTPAPSYQIIVSPARGSRTVVSSDGNNWYIQ